MGSTSTPPYFGGYDLATFNNQFANHSIIYLLGNGSATDPTLNTTDCQVTLLGSAHYSRGENIITYLGLVYPSYVHERVIVPGIGHDAQAMYQSAAFKTLLGQVLN